jgi:hypothetical protein
VLITSAAPSAPQELRGRERRYLISMLLRTVCLVLAVVLFRGWARFLAVAIAIVTPWLAVVVANGGPKRSVSRPSLYRDPTPAAPRAIPAARHEIIDLDASGRPVDVPGPAPAPGAAPGQAPG